jgi:hypothetical protein
MAEQAFCAKTGFSAATRSLELMRRLGVDDPEAIGFLR